jgi:hypothetical protein
MEPPRRAGTVSAQRAGPVNPWMRTIQEALAGLAVYTKPLTVTLGNGYLLNATRRTRSGAVGAGLLRSGRDRPGRGQEPG